MIKQADRIGPGFDGGGARALRRWTRAALLGLLVTLMPLSARAGDVVRLSPGDDLARAIGWADPGTVLELEGGDYGALRLKRAGGDAGAPITLRSADPGNPAVITAMDLREVQDLVLDGLTFEYRFQPGDPLNHRPFQVFATRRLVIENSVFDGDMEPGLKPHAPPLPAGFGLAVRASAEIRIEGNQLRDFARGFVFDDVVDITVRGNLLEALRIDGMNFAQVERVEISGNVIRDFKRDPEAQDHADMIQFWTNGTERPSRDILIRGNLLNSGQGWFTQSIFMRNEEVDRGAAGPEMFYQNVTIEENVILNAHLHGISVGETDGLTIRYNTLIHNPASDGDEPRPAMWRPQIRVAPGSRHVTVVGNAAHRLPEIPRGESWDLRDNLAIQDQDPALPNHYAALFLAAQTGDPGDLANFGYLPAGRLDGITIGAPMLAPAQVAADLARHSGRETLMPAALKLMPAPVARLRAPALRILPEAGSNDSFAFDAETGIAALGVALDDPVFRWDFGDGAGASGARATHRYENPGQYRVTLHLSLATGESVQSRATVTVLAPEVLRYQPGSGRITSFAGRQSAEVRVQDAGGTIPLGGTHALVELPPALIAPLFGSKAFELDLRLRSDSYRNAGEILRVHPFLIVTASARGTISVKIATDSHAATELVTRQVGDLFSGDWVDLTLRYADAEGVFQVLVNGTVMGEATVAGPMPPLKSWGLAFGNPFNTRKNFQGELGGLALRVLDNDSRMAR